MSMIVWLFRRLTPSNLILIMFCLVLLILAYFYAPLSPPSRPTTTNLFSHEVDHEYVQGSQEHFQKVGHLIRKPTDETAAQQQKGNAIAVEPIITDSLKSCGMLTFTHMGPMGIGNMLFEYSTLYAIARKTKRTPVIDKTQNLQIYTLFQNLSIQPVALNKSIPFKEIREKVCCIYEGRLADMAMPCDGQNYRLCCYMQSWRYFWDFIPDIRAQLHYKPEVERACDDALKATLLKGKNVNLTSTNRSKIALIGVHMRYWPKAPEKYGHPQPEPSFLRRAMQYFRDKYKNTGKPVYFLVIGNNRPLNRKWISEAYRNQSKNDVIFGDDHSQNIDFCMLTRTDHMISTSGTHAWWAAYLNGGTHVYQQKMCSPGSPMCTEYANNGSDHFLPNWIPM